jgi:hypothetical protein
VEIGTVAAQLGRAIPFLGIFVSSFRVFCLSSVTTYHSNQLRG